MVRPQAVGSPEGGGAPRRREHTQPASQPAMGVTCVTGAEGDSGVPTGLRSMRTRPSRRAR